MAVISYNTVGVVDLFPINMFAVSLKKDVPSGFIAIKRKAFISSSY